MIEHRKCDQEVLSPIALRIPFPRDYKAPIDCWIIPITPILLAMKKSIDRSIIHNEESKGSIPEVSQLQKRNI